MKIIITENQPIDSNCSDITQYIGKEFEVNESDYIYEGNPKHKIGILIKELGLEIYEGEYEIVE